MRSWKLIWGAAIACMMLCVAPTAANQDTIAYRQHLMDTLEAQFQAINLIYTAGAPPENLYSHLVVALATARAIPDAFQPRVLGGSSAPQIWTKWDDFMFYADEFEAAIAMAVEAARGGTAPQDVLYHIDAVSCRKCHDRFRRY